MTVVQSADSALTEAATSRFVSVRDGDTVFRIHYNDGWANFTRNVERLVDGGYGVVLVFCRGGGKSDPVVNTGSRSELNGRVLKAVLDELDIARVHIIGNSMGGHSAVAFALSNPSRVGKLILMGGGTGGPSQFVAMPTEGIKLLNGLYKDPTIENLKRMMNVFVFDASAITDTLMQARLDNMLACKEHLENFVKSLAANPKQFTDYGSRLGEIAAPTLIVWGREDRFVPMDVGLRLLAGLPNAQLHVFNRCGHWVQWEHAEAFNRMVIDFLKH